MKWRIGLKPWSVTSHSTIGGKGVTYVVDLELRLGVANMPVEMRFPKALYDSREDAEAALVAFILKTDAWEGVLEAQPCDETVGPISAPSAESKPKSSGSGSTAGSAKTTRTGRAKPATKCSKRQKKC